MNQIERIAAIQRGLSALEAEARSLAASGGPAWRMQANCRAQSFLADELKRLGRTITYATAAQQAGAVARGGVLEDGCLSYH